MAKDPRKRQRKLQKKAAKRKTRRRQLSRIASLMAAPSLRKAGSWPLHEVLINADWAQPQTLSQIIVARKAPNGYIAIGNFLVDRGCLGIKNAFGRVISQSDYRGYLRQVAEHQHMVAGDLNLAAKIIRDSIAYARQFGFRPNRDTGQAMLVLGNADPDQCTVEVPLGGEDGKPFFFAGPYDDVGRIIAKLTKAVGPEGFHYLLPLADTDLFDEDELLDDAPTDSIEFDDDPD